MKVKRKKLHFFVILIILTFCSMVIISIYLDFSRSICTIQTNNIFSSQSTNKSYVFELDGILEENKNPDYPTGCESVALYILLKYYNINVTIEEIVEELPKGPVPIFYGNDQYAGNPEREFVGNPKNINAFGVYNKPIAEIANKFRKGAIAQNGLKLEEIKDIIKTGNPVIAWTSIYEDYGKREYSREWRDYKTKEKIYWINGEHAVVVYGYDENNVYISNPNNGKKYSIPNKLFEYNYSKFGERVVYYE